MADFLGHSQQDATADESPVGDDLIEVYPVRTELSRWENLNADYALRIVPPVHEFKADAAQIIPAAISAHLSALPLQRRDKVAFMVNSTEPSQKTTAGLHLLCDNMFWRDQLGFNLAGYRHI